MYRIGTVLLLIAAVQVAILAGLGVIWPVCWAAVPVLVALAVRLVVRSVPAEKAPAEKTSVP
ncbi:hypothetical protein [Paractinoplanes deccanensis]|uniref:hypothetical protein n=1 Tax=Paractinoplanes deccanensis TaxID=113561 RepID=UPI001941091D|nr:hypothetical protein [Actinoplanes deccanensis]